MTEGYLQVPQVWESEGVESEEESLAGKVAVAPLKLQKQLGHVTEEVPKVWESEGVESEEESLAGKVEKERSLWRGSVGVGCTKLRPSAHVAYQAVAYQAVVHAAYQAVAYQAVLHTMMLMLSMLHTKLRLLSKLHTRLRLLSTMLHAHSKLLHWGLLTMVGPWLWLPCCRLLWYHRLLTRNGLLTHRLLTTRLLILLISLFLQLLL